MRQEMEMQSKSQHQKNVEAMMNRYRQMGNLPMLPSSPTVPDGKMIEAQARIILEEFMEVMEACGCMITVPGLPELIIERGDLKVTWIGNTEGHEVKLPEVAKELADLSVVTTGMFSEFGISDLPVLFAVDDNNLAKFAPGCYLDENRKLHKPPNHPKPAIATVLMQQGWNPEAANEKRI